MSHSKSLSILVGTTILSLILIAGITTIEDYTAALAQEDEDENEEEKEEEESSKDEENEEKEESEESESIDSNEETSSNDDEQKEEAPTETSVPNNTEIPVAEIIPEPIANLTGDHILNLEPIITEEGEVKKEFNATCKCMTTSLAAEPESTPSQQQPTPTKPSNQIPVTSANIVNSQSLGQVIDENYTGYYTVSNLLDNKIDDTSFWSQAGKSSFYIKLDNILDQYQVCSAELNVHKPTNAPYLLDVGVVKDYTGVIDQTTEKIQFDKCVKNMDEILMTFDNPDGTYISIAELKLFGSKLGETETKLNPPQTTIPTLEPVTETTENATKINIQDSIAEIAIKNSTVTFKFDPMTATFVQQQGTQ